MRLFPALSVSAALLLARPGAGAPAAALLPFENLSASPAASVKLSPLVAAELRSKGWTVVEGAAVESALDASRVRYLDSIATDIRPKLAEAMGVPVLVMGAVYAYDADSDPRVALAIRLVSADGKVIFSDLVAMRSEDAEGLFDFGKIVTREELAQEAVRRLCRRLPAPGGAPAAVRSRPRPLHVSGVRTYRSAALAPGKRHRIALLPFANAASHDAARIVAELFARRLASSILFEPVDPADLRAAVVAEKVRDLSDPAELVRLGKRLGTTLFLKGTIYDFSEPVQASSETPKLEMSTSLVDVATGEIVWTSYASRFGTDYQGLLELGAITGIVGLADQSASEMIRAAEKASPSSGRRPGDASADRAARKEKP